MPLTLIDTSAWIDFFRGGRAAKVRIDPLLGQRRAATCGPVLAEVLSGAPNQSTFARLESDFQALRMLTPTGDPWFRLATARFQLARLGAQVSLADLWIGLTAADGGVTLLTRDGDFEQIARVLPFELERF